MKLTEILRSAKRAARNLATVSGEKKNAALQKMSESLLANAARILEANALDVENNRERLGEVMLDRLRLDQKRIEGMARGILDLIALPDPVGKVLEKTERPNGLKITKLSVPLGVIGIIYESRPNVTSDAAALCIKSGNACVLRCGKEAYQTSCVIVSVLRAAIKESGLDENCVNITPDPSREVAAELMNAVGLVDALIPRGGAGLIKHCIENAKVPCIQTGTGICHLYVDEAADLEKALTIIENAKTSRPSVCNALEVCIVHEKIAATFLPALKKRLQKVELRCDGKANAYVGGRVATNEDFDTEFLDYILAVKTVGSLEEAVEHIANHSTGHSDGIITEDKETAQAFVAAVDSAAVYVNASTRFTDGGEFGKGCEIGISTQKLHARGPMGLEELTSYKYLVVGDGQIR